MPRQRGGGKQPFDTGSGLNGLDHSNPQPHELIPRFIDGCTTAGCADCLLTETETETERQRDRETERPRETERQKDAATAVGPVQQAPHCSVLFSRC